MKSKSTTKREAVLTASDASEAPRSTASYSELIDTLAALEPGKSYEVSFMFTRINGGDIIQSIQIAYRKRV